MTRKARLGSAHSRLRSFFKPQPPLPPHSEPRCASRNPAVAAILAGRAEAAGARSVPPLLELLVNLSCADPRAIAVWLTDDGASDWSPSGPLAGLEAELNNRDEKVSIVFRGAEG